MKVLVATRETQGFRADDYCWTVEGELVRLPGLTCDCPDRGCDRGMAGLSSSRATTTAKVVNREDLDPRTYGALLCDALTPHPRVWSGEASWRAFVGDSATPPSGAPTHVVRVGFPAVG